MSVLLETAQEPAGLLAALEAAWQGGAVVGLACPEERPALRQSLASPGVERAVGAWGPGLLLASGGSSAERCESRRWCLQPLEHLEASAAATGAWLQDLGLDPAACLHLDPLPLHHVSGLLPLLRCRCWGAELRGLPAALLRQPEQLAQALPLPADRPVLLSLVPTQLERLLSRPEGIDWLRGCSVIWVGGAGLSPAQAAAARAAQLPLAPCYGASETAAMVCALEPRRFLAGERGCGAPLVDVRLRLDPGSGAVEVVTARLSPGFLVEGGWQPLPRTADGWWRSGDGGRWLRCEAEADVGWGSGSLELLGRLDGAISSGGETVFPEQVEAALAGVPQLAALLLLGRLDPLWGERLEALVRPEPGADGAMVLAALQQAAKALPPPQRPRAWHLCPELAPNGRGKWERRRWLAWLQAQDDGSRGAR
jgi:O-succinylbenzoic acid--CoA ligase